MRKIMKVLVNMLTIFRLIFAVVLAFIFNKITKSTFLITISLLFFTDCLDGLIARKFKVQTLFGSTMDTIADKTLSIVLIILIIKKTTIMYILLVSEILIAIINTIRTFIGRKIGTTIIGKIKMWTISISIILGYTYYFNYTSYSLVFIMSIITFVLQLLVIASYLRMIFDPNFKRKKIKARNKQNLKYMLFNTDYYLNLKL